MSTCWCSTRHLLWSQIPQCHQRAPSSHLTLIKYIFIQLYIFFNIYLRKLSIDPVSECPLLNLLLFHWRRKGKRCKHSKDKSTVTERKDQSCKCRIHCIHTCRINSFSMLLLQQLHPGTKMEYIYVEICRYCAKSGFCGSKNSVALFLQELILSSKLEMAANIDQTQTLHYALHCFSFACSVPGIVK